MAKIEISPLNGVAVTIFVFCIVAGTLATLIMHYPAPLIVGALLGTYLLFAIKVVQQWEKVALLRLGRYVGLRGPGLFYIVPIVQRILDEKTNPWGITVQSVEIRDVRIPQALEDAMSRQAQAERERQARIILGQAETEISDKFVQAAAAYRENPVALHLRAMNMLYEAIKEKGSMVIVPSSAVETMGLGGSLATTALAKGQGL
jgi:regulator of protease activity HflC (stomatin/prohibitin superfamily)